MLVVGVVALAAEPAHAAPVSTLACGSPAAPVEITSDVALSADLTCDEASWSVAPGVTLDLRAHTITVAQTENCRVFGWNLCNLDVGSGTVRNGTIKGASVSVRDGSFHHLLLRGGSIAVTRKGSIDHSIFYESAVTLASGGSLAYSWVVKGTGIELYNTEFPVRDLSITNNIVLNNTGAGIRSFGRVFFDDDISGTIDSNIIAGNTGDGIVFGGLLQALGTLDIANNVVLGNGGSGIVVSGEVNPSVSIEGGPVTITANTAVYNRGRGIDAPDAAPTFVQIVDGGHNIGFANALSPQCIGVTC